MPQAGHRGQVYERGLETGDRARALLVQKVDPLQKQARGPSLPAGFYGMDGDGTAQVAAGPGFNLGLVFINARQREPHEGDGDGGDKDNDSSQVHRKAVQPVDDSMAH